MITYNYRNITVPLIILNDTFFTIIFIYLCQNGGDTKELIGALTSKLFY
jgi:hypothetical protein